MCIESGDFIPTVSLTMSANVYPSQIFMPSSKIDISSTLWSSKNILESAFASKSYSLNCVSIFKRSAPDNHSSGYDRSDDPNGTQNVMISKNILRQTDRFSPSPIGQATQLIIQSNVINSSDSLMARQILLDLDEAREQYSFGIIGSMAIFGSLILIAIIVVIIIVFKFRSETMSTTDCQLSDDGEKELTGELFAEIDYFHPSIDQLQHIAFENPATCNEDMTGVSTCMRSDSEESSWLRHKNLL
jgi:hypothetical protein